MLSLESTMIKTKTMKVTIPKNWNPECKQTVSSWFEKIGEYQSKEDTIRIQNQVIG